MVQDIRERYINPYTDFGFKKLFGTEMNKDLLISFLNALFMGHQNVKEVKCLPTEHFGVYGDSRRAIFDVYCEDENGGKQEQAKVGGEWDFNLKDVYTVGILNFVFRDDEYSNDCYHHEAKLMDTATKKVFYDKLTYIYLEMLKFNKKQDELETMFDNINNAINTAKAEAKVEANTESARKMKTKGFFFEDIADITGLSIKEIETL